MPRARRAESSTRAQTMAGRETRKGLRRHPDLPRVWVSNPIEFLSTEDVWAYLLQKLNQQLAVKNDVQPLKMVLFVDEAHLLLPKENKAGLLSSLARQGGHGTSLSGLARC